MDEILLDIYIKAGYLALKKQKTDGSLPCGKNGPHNHNMTTARNTGHFSILFLFLYQQTSNPIWKIAAQKAISHLMTLRPLEGSFWHRKHPFKPSYNGLIGQAWSLEALIVGYNILKDEKYLECAKNLIDSYKFDHKEFLWYEVDLDGSLRPINMTLNQQIWFTAMVAKICNDNLCIKNNVCEFLSHIEQHMKCRSNGLVYTRIYLKNRSYSQKLAKKILNIIHYENRNEIDTGYHVFTLTGLAILYETIPEHHYFQSKQFRKILTFSFSDKYLKAFKKSKFGYEYNVIGFELPYVWTIFRQFLNENALAKSIEVYNEQLKHYSSETNGLLACNSFDTETLAARIYEVYRINNPFWEVLSCKNK